MNQTKQAINFNTGATHNYAELATETRDNLYVARIWKNGNTEFAHNCYIVSVLPKSPVSDSLLRAWEEHKELLRCYLATDDINTRNELFWSIRHKLQSR